MVLDIEKSNNNNSKAQNNAFSKEFILLRPNRYLMLNQIVEKHQMIVYCNVPQHMYHSDATSISEKSKLLENSAISGAQIE